MTVRSKELRQERGKLWEEAKGLVEAAEKEKRNLSGEEQAKYEKLETGMAELKTRIDRAEFVENEGRALEMSQGAAAGRAPIGDPIEEDPKKAEALEKRAFHAFVRGGVASIEDPELRKVAASRLVSQSSPELRAQGVATGGAGGYLVPQGFSNAIDIALKDYSGVMQACEAAGSIIDTASGADLPWPSVNDTAQVGEQLGENAQAASQDVTIGSTTLKAYMFSSKVVLVSLQLLQDSFFNMDDFLSGRLAERIGRILNQKFTTGTGAGATPNGAVTAANVGVTLPVGNTIAITYDGIIDLIHSLDPAYRRSKGAALMMHDTTLKTVKKIKDSQNRPLWQPGMAVKEPDTIWGYPYFINQDMAVPAANAKTILFGDWTKYKVRRVRDFTLLRLTERYADFLQVGFLGFGRYDGNLIDAGTKPMQVLVQSAT